MRVSNGGGDGGSWNRANIRSLPPHTSPFGRREGSPSLRYAGARLIRKLCPSYTKYRMLNLEVEEETLKPGLYCDGGNSMMEMKCKRCKCICSTA
ncbi:hypothetical protein Trydic_g911 [Trypoxylus dichotomus]